MLARDNRLCLCLSLSLRLRLRLQPRLLRTHKKAIIQLLTEAVLITIPGVTDVLVGMSAKKLISL